MFDAISGRHALLLQGPMGPFFWRLKKELLQADCRVSKVNFNFADFVFYPDRGAIDYRGTLRDWSDYFRSLLKDRKVDIIFLFGDARPYHLCVIEIALSMAIPVYCFEEGYLRPDYITLERCGVNGFSNLPRNPEFYLEHQLVDVPEPKHVKSGFSCAAWYAIAYCFFMRLFALRYPHYQHHRSLLAIPEGLYWIRAAFRKHWFGLTERKWLPRLSGQLSNRYFFVPLQVHNDAQIYHHSKYESIEAFIEEVISSFADHAQQDQYLVIKHHPLDRGYRDYTRKIKRLARQYNVQQRVIYVHDLHLPTLLKHARGSVMINSTVGLSSILHQTPVKTLGDAVFDMPGLVSQSDLKSFWQDQGEIDFKLYQHFRNWLLTFNQLNGNFYKPIEGAANPTGVVWDISEPFKAVFKQSLADVVLLRRRLDRPALANERGAAEKKAS